MIAMPEGVLIAVITGVLSLFAAALLALVNSWVGTRAGVDESLRAQRLDVYPPLWSATAAISRWPRMQITRSSLGELHQLLRSWYYSKGGLFLSEHARDRYGDVQRLVEALLTSGGAPDDVLGSDGYADLMRTASALRTALTADLDTRRRKSALESRRRDSWNATAAVKAECRIGRAVGAVWVPADKQGSVG